MIYSDSFRVEGTQVGAFEEEHWSGRLQWLPAEPRLRLTEIGDHFYQLSPRQALGQATVTGKAASSGEGRCFFGTSGSHGGRRYQDDSAEVFWDQWYTWRDPQVYADLPDLAGGFT